MGMSTRPLLFLDVHLLYLLPATGDLGNVLDDQVQKPLPWPMNVNGWARQGQSPRVLARRVSRSLRHGDHSNEQQRMVCDRKTEVLHLLRN